MQYVCMYEDDVSVVLGVDAASLTVRRGCLQERHEREQQRLRQQHDDDMRRVQLVEEQKRRQVPLAHLHHSTFISQ